MLQSATGWGGSHSVSNGAVVRVGTQAESSAYRTHIRPAPKAYSGGNGRVARCIGVGPGQGVGAIEAADGRVRQEVQAACACTTGLGELIIVILAARSYAATQAEGQFPLSASPTRSARFHSSRLLATTSGGGDGHSACHDVYSRSRGTGFSFRALFHAVGLCVKRRNELDQPRSTEPVEHPAPGCIALQHTCSGGSSEAGTTNQESGRTAQYRRDG
ncbi:Uncharacterised protein [Clostridioides difficile]|nr:Uncharacterised protein [Clostridioides difficile]